MRIAAATFFLLISAATVEAAQKKNWYLRIDNGAGGEAYVFKSKAACEAEGRRRLKIQKIFDQMPKNIDRKYRYSNPRCMNRLPYGYMPPS